MADKHVGDGENQFKVVATTPDVCQVGCSAIPFDSFQSLDAQKQYALSVKARGYCTLNVGSIIKGTQSNTGAGVLSGTSLGGGDCQIITGSPSVRIEGQPAAQDGSLVAMNNNNTLGTLITNVAPPAEPIESNKIPCNNPPVTSELLESLQEMQREEQESFIGRLRQQKQQADKKRDDSLNDIDKQLTEYIDNIRIEHINTDYSWWNSLYNTSMDGITGLTRGGLGFVESTTKSAVEAYYYINPTDLVQNVALNASKKTIEGLIEAENWRLGNNCIEGVKEDAKAKYRALGKLIDEEKEKLENKWKKSDSDKVEIVTRGGLEIATIAAAFLKVGKVAEGANAINKVAEGTKITEISEGTSAVNKATDVIKATETSNISKGSEAIKGAEISATEKGSNAAKGTEVIQSPETPKITSSDNGIKIEGKTESVSTETPPNKANNSQTENKSTSSSKESDGNSTSSATCKGEPVNVATGDFIQQWPIIQIPGLLPLSLHRTYKSTSNAKGLFGPKWADEWSRCLHILDGNIIYQDSDGANFTFITPTEEIRARNAHAPHFLLTGQRDGDLTLFDSTQQQFLHFNHRQGKYRRLSAITDLNQHRIDFIYNEQSQLVSVKRHDGIALILEYQQDKLVRICSESTTSSPRDFVRCEYDTHGYLSQCHAYQQNHLWHRYSPEGLMVAWGDTDSTEVMIDYDEQGRVVATRSPSGFWNDRFIYDDYQRMTTYIDGEGGFSRYYYNDDNLVTRTIDPLWCETYTEWEQRKKIAEINEIGERTEYGYHYNGLLAYIYLPDGKAIYYDYNDYGQLTHFTSAFGDEWQLSYDDNGNLTIVTDPQGRQQVYEYSQHGELLKAITPNGAQWQYHYNPAHQLIKTTNPYQHSTEYHSDELGRLLHYTDALNHTTRYQYSTEHASTNGSLSKILLPDGVEQQIDYDSERRVIAVTDGEGKTTRYRYGPFDVLLAMIRPDGSEIRFEYDSLTRLKKVVNANGEVYLYERDKAGQIIREVDFTGREICYRYDRLGRRIATRYPDNHELRWRYNESGLVVEQSEWFEDEQESRCLSTTQYSYNARQQLIKATNPDSVVEFEYDDQGRLCSERINGQEIVHQWNDTDNTLALTRFGERELHYAFGALGELTSLQVNQHAPLQFSYNAVGQEYLRRSHAGFVNSSHYTATGLLAHQRAGRGTEQFLQSIQAHPQQPPFCTDVHRSYQYDRAYNVVGIEDDRWRQTRYHYNANDQITETQYSPQWGNQDEKFQYDNNLNITEHLTTPSSSMVPSEAQGAMLQLFQQQQAGRVTRRYTAKGYQDYHYDVNGRLAKKIVHTRGFRPREWRYLWNTQNQLTACFTPKGDCWHYTYDAFGRRLSKTKTVDSDLAHIDPLFPQIKPKITTWRYLWSGDQLIEETPIYADGTLAESQQIQWLYQPGEITPTARYQQGKLHYVVTDHQGTPREIFSEGGQASWAGRLNTWGQMQFWRYREGKAENDPNYTECPFRFAGQYEDEESGLYYNRFRYYDRETGQYLSPDPIGLLGGLNPYGYVHCPTGWVDPFGLECCPPTLNRTQALNKAKDLAGIPRSQQPVRQWTVGNDPKRRGQTNYQYSEDFGSHGRYYEYRDANGYKKVVLEHTHDPRAPYPHAHAGQAKTGADPRTYDFKQDRYLKIDDPKTKDHHIYYE
ncbi:DUF4150 domain-containing protein [Proteus mirabilis]|nr:DUF4150 domain-containing protein [Proteus mirabilis]